VRNNWVTDLNKTSKSVYPTLKLNLKQPRKANFDGSTDNLFSGPCAINEVFTDTDSTEFAFLKSNMIRLFYYDLTLDNNFRSDMWRKMAIVIDYAGNESMTEDEGIEFLQSLLDEGRRQYQEGLTAETQRLAVSLLVQKVNSSFSSHSGSLEIVHSKTGFTIPVFMGKDKYKLSKGSYNATYLYMHKDYVEDLRSS
jgi:hypothetical protein